MQKLRLDATGFEGYQAQVAADSIFLMDDRGAWLEIIKLSNDRLGVAIALATPLARRGSFAEQLLFADDCKMRTWQQHAVIDGGDCDADTM